MSKENCVFDMVQRRNFYFYCKGSFSCSGKCAILGKWNEIGD